VIPHWFSYHAPTSVDDVVALSTPESVLLGGGTWVVPALGDPRNRVARVIDLRRAGLGGIENGGDRVRLGAMVTYTDLLRSKLAPPLLRLVAAGVTGGPQIQSQGTIGGAACAAKPSSDLPCALLALDATATIRGRDGTRAVPVSELWPDPFRTTLADDEVLAGFEVPVSRGGFAYRKLKCGTSSWPIVSVAVVATVDGDGLVGELRVAVGAAAAVPFLVPTLSLAGHSPSPALAEEAGERASVALADPWSDEIAPAGYRATVLPAIVRRAVADALEDCRA
jgi:aerobic carbon-monoxide dehydrogenase medium subunit